MAEMQLFEYIEMIWSRGGYWLSDGRFGPMEKTEFQQGRRKWTYYFQASILRQLGRDWWELVFVGSGVEGDRYVFKRPPIDDA